MWDKGCISNPSNCKCECNKSSKIGELLHYKNCKSREKIIDKLLEECSENIDENKMLYNDTFNTILLNTIPLNDCKKVCGSCTFYIILFSVFLVASTVISTAFICSCWYSENNITNAYY